MPPNSVGVLMLAQLERLRPLFGQPRDERLSEQIMEARDCLPKLRDRVAGPLAAWPWHESPAHAPPVTIDPRRGDPGDTTGLVLAVATDSLPSFFRVHQGRAAAVRQNAGSRGRLATRGMRLGLIARRSRHGAIRRGTAVGLSTADLLQSPSSRRSRAKDEE